MKKNFVEANPKRVKLTKNEPIRLKLPNSTVIAIDDELKKIYKVRN